MALIFDWSHDSLGSPVNVDGIVIIIILRCCSSSEQHRRRRPEPPGRGVRRGGTVLRFHQVRGRKFVGGPIGKGRRDGHGVQRMSRVKGGIVPLDDLSVVPPNLQPAMVFLG